MTQSSESLVEKLADLRPFAERVSTVRFDPLRPFSACLRFSFSKAFEFAELASQQEPENAYFLIPALRAITEDVIFFSFLTKCSSDDREMVVKNLMLIDVADKLGYQQKFFHSFRPFQRVLSSDQSHKDEIETRKEELRDFWRRNGWPCFGKRNRKDYMPPIIQLAQKSPRGLLEIVYDFIYRLTSGEVHSSPRVLLRLGWGTSQASGEFPSSATFTTKNLGRYHLSVIQIYGTYLLCLCFELFGPQIGVGPEERTAVESVREHLLSILHWPEMVTFDEMNMPVPPPFDLSLD